MPGSFHSHLQVGGFLHAFGEGEQLELLARIAAGLGQFSENVLQGRQTDVVIDILFAG